MSKRIYIETTIPSFYYTLHSDDESQVRMKWTRQWWKEYANLFELNTSAAVIEELQGSAKEIRQERIDLLDGVELLEVTKEIQDIAQAYIDQLVMPKDPAGDALHLAVSSFHGVDCLLTWNCRHLANVNKFEHIRKVNDGLGLVTPELTTPLNFLGGSEDDE